MKTLKALALGTVPVVGGFLCLLLFQVCTAVRDASVAIQDASAHEAVISTRVVTELDALHMTTDRVSSEMDSLHSVTADLDVVAKGVSRTVKELDYPNLQAGVTSKKEADMLDGWNDELTHTLTHADAALVTLDASTAAVSKEAVATMVTSQDALVAGTKVLSDPSIAETLSNMQTATLHASATTADVQQAVYKYLHPGWGVRLWNWSLSVAHVLGGWF